MQLEILYKDDCIVAVNKPHGLLVHRTKIADDAEEFALQILRDQLGQSVYPAHRLDRKTGGVLIFALNEETNRSLQINFANNQIKKTYWALVRGFTESDGVIDYALKRDDGKIQDAMTIYRTLQHFEIPIPFGKFNSSRYSLVEVYPQTGRMHQIRKHFAHIYHPIIGDRPHGCNKQNKLFLERFQMNTMLLHARQIELIHPVNNEKIIIEATLQNDFQRILNEMRK